MKIDGHDFSNECSCAYCGVGKEAYEHHKHRCRSPLSKTERDLSPIAQQALSILHSSKKSMSEIVEWTALDCFRMRKSEVINNELIITVKDFQIKEVG